MGRARSLFAAQCADLRAEFFLCVDRAEMQERLAALGRECGWRRMAVHPGDLTDAATELLALPTLTTERGYDMIALEQCEAALTECDALVAQTGSVLITSLSAGAGAVGACAASCGFGTARTVSHLTSVCPALAIVALP